MFAILKTTFVDMFTWKCIVIEISLRFPLKVPIQKVCIRSGCGSMPDWLRAIFCNNLVIYMKHWLVGIGILKRKLNNANNVYIDINLALGLL